MHSFYLRNMYLKNLLGVSDGIELDGVPIDLAKVKLQTYFISMEEDHIAPWKTTYKGAKHLGGTVRFVLGGSGHIAGIVNPPAAKKSHYWTNQETPPTPELWLENAKQCWLVVGRLAGVDGAAKRRRKGASTGARWTRTEGDRGCARQLRDVAFGSKPSE